MNKLIIYCAAGIVIAALFRCAQLGGGVGSEAEARVLLCGHVIDFSTGMPASRTQVRLLPATYDPIKDKSAYPVDTTDAAGNFQFDVPRGTYSANGVALEARTRFLVSDIAAQEDTVIVTTGVLKRPGVLRVTLPDGADYISGYIYVPGTPIGAMLADAPGNIIIDSVPAGVLPSIVYGTTTGRAERTIRKDVTIVSDDTARVYLPYWLYSRQLLMNTTPSGADVAGTVTNFPVLVRLSSSNFPFAGALPDGRDIRFTKADGTALPCEIEQWDAAAQTAAVWVRVDTVYGNDSSRWITMCWGNPNAASVSNGAAVFDTGNGFAAVYHLGETAGNAVDATINRLDGTPMGKPLNQAAGAIGFAPSFSGDGDYYDAGNSAKLDVSPKNQLTVSAWVKRADLSISSSDEGIAGKYNWVSGAYREYMLANRPGVGFVFEFSSNGDTAHGGEGETKLYANVIPANDTWYYVAGVVSDSAIRIFVDGKEQNSSAKTTVFRPTLSTFKIGLIDDYRSSERQYWNGVIDEVVVSATDRSADWIKLCYENQRAGQKFLTMPGP